jgi:hypothetical protein
MIILDEHSNSTTDDMQLRYVTKGAEQQSALLFDLHSPGRLAQVGRDSAGALDVGLERPAGRRGRQLRLVRRRSRAGARNLFADEVLFGDQLFVGGRLGG